MHLMKVDPRALLENPDRSRHTPSTPQADALMLATIKAVGIVQPPVIVPQTDGGNGFIIDRVHRRVRMAIAADLAEIEVLVDEPANDNGAMRSIVENVALEALNPVDEWRATERLIALGWTEEGIAIALALPLRRIKQLRLFANVLPAMLDQFAKGDLPNEQLRTIAAATNENGNAQQKARSDARLPYGKYAGDRQPDPDVEDAFLFEISLAAPYPEDYEQTVAQASRETTEVYLPPLAGSISDIERYDEIFLDPTDLGHDRAAGHPRVRPSPTTCPARLYIRSSPMAVMALEVASMF